MCPVSCAASTGSTPATSYAVWSVPPQIRYARSGSVNIAYQIAGAGTVDLLMIHGWVTHLALDWHERRWARWFERMTAFARIVRFDKRGTGMSDRPLGIPTAGERMADVVAGANLGFSDRGARELTGIERRRRVFAVTVESNRS